MSRIGVGFACLALMAGAWRAPAQAPGDSTRIRLILKGISAFEAGEFQTAVERYSEALEAFPGDPAALYERAMAYSRLGEYDACVADGRAGLTGDSPLRPQLYSMVGTCLAADGRTEQAMDIFLEGLGQYPNDLGLNFNVAVTLTHAGQPGDARAYLKKVLTDEPNYPTANLYLAQLFQAEGYRVPALYQYLRFLSVEPVSPRSASASTAVLELLSADVTESADPEPVSTLLAGGPTDEGDFRLLGQGLSELGRLDSPTGDSPPSPAARVADIIESAVALAEEREEIQMRETFVWEHAIRFMIDLRREGHLEPFTYLAFSQLGLEGLDQWIASHQREIDDLVIWLEANATPR